MQINSADANYCGESGDPSPASTSRHDTARRPSGRRPRLQPPLRSPLPSRDPTMTMHVTPARLLLVTAWVRCLCVGAGVSRASAFSASHQEPARTRVELVALRCGIGAHTGSDLLLY